MSHSSNICAFLFKKRREGLAPGLWDVAEPISLDEMRVQLLALTRKHAEEKPNYQALEHEALTLEQLWKVFEQLEDVDDCQMIG